MSGLPLQPDHASDVREARLAAQDVSLGGSLGYTGGGAASVTRPDYRALGRRMQAEETACYLDRITDGLSGEIRRTFPRGFSEEALEDLRAIHVALIRWEAEHAPGGELTP